jgi:hypothetical protein
MTSENGQPPFDSSEGAPANGNIPHLPYSLRQRFPETRKPPEVAENFIVHHVLDTDSNPYVIYQALPKLGRQTGLLDTIKKNRRAARSARDEYIHQRLEIVDAQVEGEPFYLIESQEGKSLATIIDAEKQLLPEESVRIISTLLKALEPIHEAGLVYGSMDLDLIRIVQSQQGDYVKLGGLFRVHEPDHPVRLGFNPEFNAPHGPEGEPYWTPQDDIYVVGVIAYRLLVGREAYYNTFKSTLEASPETRAGAWENIHRTRDSFPLPTTINPKVPKEFEEWSKRALETNRTERYPNAHVAREALDRALKEYEASRAAGPFDHRDPAWLQERGPIAVGAGTGAKSEKKKRLFIYGAAGLSAAASIAILAILFSGPSAEQMKAIDALRKEAAQLIRLHQPDIQKLSEENEIVVALKSAINSYNRGDGLYPPSTDDYETAVKAFDEAEKKAQKANAEFEELESDVTALQQAIEPGLAALVLLVPEGAGMLAEMRDKHLSAANLAETGKLGQAKQALSDLQTQLEETTKTQTALRDAAQSSLTNVGEKIEALAAAGVMKLSAENAIRTQFQEVNSALIQAKAMFAERKWVECAGKVREAAASLSAVEKDFQSAKKALDEGIATANASLKTLGALLPDSAPQLADFQARLDGITKNREEFLFKRAETDLATLQDQLNIGIEQKEAERDDANTILSDAGKMVARVNLLASADTDIIVSNAVKTFNLAQQAFEARRYRDAEQYAEDVLQQLTEKIAELETLREKALNAKAALSGVKDAEELTWILALQPDHVLRARLGEAGDMEAAANLSLKSRDWQSATNRFQNAKRVLEAEIQAIGSLKNQVTADQTQITKDIAALEDAGALENDTRQELQTSMRAISDLVAQDRLDTAALQLSEINGKVTELKAKVPDTIERLNNLAKQIAALKAQLDPLTENLASGHPLRKQSTDLGNRFTRLNKGSKTQSLKQRISSYQDLLGTYEALNSQVVDLVKMATAATGELDQTLETARTVLPADDQTIADAARERSELETSLGKKQFDAVIDRAAQVQATLGQAIKRSENEKAQFNKALTDLSGRIQSVVNEHGDWVINIAAFKPIAEQFAAIDKNAKDRNYIDGSAVIEEALANTKDWQAAIVSLKNQMETLSAAVESARSLAEEANAQDTTAFQSALTANEAAKTAREKKRFSDVVEHYGRAAKLFEDAIKEQAENSQAVAAIRSYFGQELERARDLLPEDDGLIAEVDEALSLPADQVKDGSLSRRRSFEALRDRLDTRVSEAQTQKSTYETGTADLHKRFEALKTAGGQASPVFTQIDPDFDAASGFAAERNWFFALEALQRVETAISGIEKAIKEGTLLACPDPTGPNGTRLVPAGSYANGRNTLAGHILKDATKAMRMTDDLRIVVKVSIPFCASMRQVTVEEFDSFVEETGYDTGSRKRLLDAAGGKLAGPDDVRYVNKADADAYAAWLSEKTGKNYQLPTLDQTLASVVYAMDAEPRIHAIVNGIENDPREWTRETCRGEDSVIVAGSIGSGNNRVFAQCLSSGERSPSIGFRLVIVN